MRVRAVTVIADGIPSKILIVVYLNIITRDVS